MNWKITVIGVVFMVSTMITIFLLGYIDFYHMHLWWGDPLSAGILALWMFFCAGLLIYFVSVLDDN